MKLFLLAVLCALAASAFASFEYDSAILEDASFLGQIRERVRLGLEKAADWLREMVDKHKPLLENLKEKVTALQQKIKDLALQTGDRLTAAVTQVRERIRQLIRDVISKITKKDVETVSYSLYEADEPTGLQKLIEIVRDRIQAAFARVKDFIAKHAESIPQILKDKVEALKTKLSELASEHGAKLLEKATSLLANLRTIFQNIVDKIGQKQETALYAAQQEEEGFLQALNRRIRERLQEALAKLKDRLSEVKDGFTEKILPKIDEIRQKISELAQKSGEKLLEAAASLGAKIRELVKAARDHFLGETATALYDDNDDEEADPTFLQRLIKRFQNRLTATLDKVKEMVANHKEIAESVQDKFTEIASGIAELAKQKGRELRTSFRSLAAKIVALNKAILEKIGVGSYQNYADFDIGTAIRTLRDFFITDAGVAALKDNASKANPTSDTGNLIKAYVLAASPEGLKELIGELFKGLNYSTYQENIRDLVIQASKFLQTAEGMKLLRAYAEKLQTSHPIVLRLKTMLVGASDDAVRSVISDIFTLH